MDRDISERNSASWSILPVYEGSRTSAPPAPHRFTFRNQADLLIVTQQGAPADVEEVRSFMIAAQREMTRARTGRILFDNRDTSAVSEEVSAVLNEWIQDTDLFERVGLLVKSELLVVRINMGALAKKVPVRAFHEEQPAVLWISRS